MREFGVGFLPSQVRGIGVQITNTLTNVLWYLDIHHDKFKQRSIFLPFGDFQGFNDYVKQKKKRPMLLSSELGEHIIKSDL